MGLFGRRREESPPPPPPTMTSSASMQKQPDMFETIFNMKFTAKQLGKLSKKCEQHVVTEKKKCKAAMEKGNVEGAKIYAENAIRNEKQALQYLKLQSRVEAVASKLEGHSKMIGVANSMGIITDDLNSVLTSMDLNHISNVMDTFEKQFEDLDVQGAYMDNAISDATATSTPQSEVNKLLQQVADEHQIQLGAEILGGQVPTSQLQAGPSSVSTNNTEERFKNLQGGL
mmetsp:Transcript_1580/g.4740  ORF Transcript_1580/g.4740 Transcript_1580/m.4740 type:complete len:229 (-) Transcript_1580:1559-2245(-)